MSNMKNRRKYIIFVIVAVLVVVLDQVTKSLALTLLEDGRKLAIIGDFLTLRLVRNSGAAFSMLAGYTWVLTLLSLIFVIALPFLLKQIKRLSIVVALSVLWGGAIGNFIDRLTQPPTFGSGHVVDFIDYGGFFVGNVADIAIVVAAVVTVLLAGIDSREQKTGYIEPSNQEDSLA